METKHKELYETPETEVLELKSEGVICTSGDVIDPLDPFVPGGDPFILP
jgi:hypothetical protein